MQVPDIFLSYNRDDQDRALHFAQAFEAQGYSVWWDVGLRTGEAYDEVTETALRTAKAVVVLWSKQSVASRWVRAEATLADRNKTLVPCMIEPCERPIMFELTHTAELGHWKGEPRDAAWLMFLSDVARFVARDCPPAQPAIVRPAAALVPVTPGTHETPSLAVLPFTNRSGNPDDEVFADGMVEDIISALTQGAPVRVLGAMVTASFKNSAIGDVATLGQRLGVDYLLEGNVRRAGANLRVTTQLLKAATGEVVWSGRFDRPLSELAALQERLVLDVAGHLNAQVLEIEMVRALRKPANLTAWEAAMRSLAAFRQFDGPSMFRAVEEAERAVAIAPDFAGALASLASARSFVYQFFAAMQSPEEQRRIKDLAERACALAPGDAMVLSAAGAALAAIGYPVEGLRYTEKAIQKAPGQGLAHLGHGIACYKVRRDADALSHLSIAQQYMQGSNLVWIATIWMLCPLSALHRYEEGLRICDEVVSLTPTAGSVHFYRAAFLSRLGRDSEALADVRKAREFGETLDMIEARENSVHGHRPEILANNLSVVRNLWAAAEAEQ